MDMKEVNPNVFIESDKPEEISLGILAGKFKEKSKIIKDVIKRITEIEKNKEKVINYMENISFLAGLFDVDIKLEGMPIEIDIRKTFLYKAGKQEGLEGGEQKGLKEGLLKGLTDAVLMDVQVKLGRQQANQVKNLLGKIDDII
jgi:predicted transposase YdaD